MIFNIQTFSANINNIKKTYFGSGTKPIHNWNDYEREVNSRLNSYLQSKPSVISKSLAARIIKKIVKLRPFIINYENKPIFSHRDFFDKNIIVSNQSSIIFLVDFEHAAIVNNYLLGLNFDLANIVVQWYRYPRLCQKLISLVRVKHADKKNFDLSLEACLIIQILAKIDPLAQKMTPGGVRENINLLRKLV